jgi:hypothetical protein
VWVVTVLFGVGLIMGPVTAAQARDVPVRHDVEQDVAVPDDPTFTLPFERPDGPIGSGIYGGSSKLSGLRG